jgi:DegV family protein with EDD domain
MSKIILSTESGADLPKDLAEKHHVQVVPMHVIMDGEDHLDGVLPVTDIYDYHTHTKQIPSTTATNIHEYQQFFKKIKEDFPDCTIIHIGYTSKASSSFQNAVIAAEEFDNVILIDALNVTGGLAAIVLFAVTILDKNPTIEPELLSKLIQDKVPKSRLAFVPGNLDFLKAGGRVSNAAYIGAALLKIKPRIDLLEGKLVSTKKYRGNMTAVTKKLMNDYLTQYNIDREQLYLIYSLGLDEEIKQQMDKMARDNGFKQVTWIQAGAMISTHAGPGGFGIAGLEV